MQVQGCGRLIFYICKDSACNDFKRTKLNPLFLLRSLLSLHLFFESCLYLQALELWFLFEMENHLNGNAFSPEHAQADLQQITAILLDIYRNGAMYVSLPRVLTQLKPELL